MKFSYVETPLAKYRIPTYIRGSQDRQRVGESYYFGKMVAEISGFFAAADMAVARGERRIAPGEPKVWFTSTESFAKVLSAGNRDLLRVIAEQAPASLDELARITGKAKSNLSRTLKTVSYTHLDVYKRQTHRRARP